MIIEAAFSQLIKETQKEVRKIEVEPAERKFKH